MFSYWSPEQRVRQVANRGTECYRRPFLSAAARSKSKTTRSNRARNSLSGIPLLERQGGLRRGEIFSPRAKRGSPLAFIPRRPYGGNIVKISCEILESFNPGGAKAEVNRVVLPQPSSRNSLP
jgi:hypothetical protein